VVEKKTIEDLGLDDIATLKGLATAVKDGDTTVDEAFPAPALPVGRVKVGEINTAPANGPTARVAAPAPVVSAVAETAPTPVQTDEWDKLLDDGAEKRIAERI
jgi:hypothetical protein